MFFSHHGLWNFPRSSNFLILFRWRRFDWPRLCERPESIWPCSGRISLWTRGFGCIRLDIPKRFVFGIRTGWCIIPINPSNRFNFFLHFSDLSINDWGQREAASNASSRAFNKETRTKCISILLRSATTLSRISFSSTGARRYRKAMWRRLRAQSFCRWMLRRQATQTKLGAVGDKENYVRAIETRRAAFDWSQ